MGSKKTVWGEPGSTGVTDDGIPWYVPEKGPNALERLQYKLFPVSGKYMPAGARFVPARTAEDVRERCLRKYGAIVEKLLDPRERIIGFAPAVLGDEIPQTPRTEVGKKAGPNRLRHWWMGGDWDTMAGQLVLSLGSVRVHAVVGYSGPLDRKVVWVRTDQRIVLLAGFLEAPEWLDASYGPGQVGIRPGWQPGGRYERRVDIAFIDGSWLGLTETDIGIPGGTEGCPVRDLIADLAGPPVTPDVLPARGLGS